MLLDICMIILFFVAYLTNAKKKEKYVYSIIASIWVIMTYTISLKAKKKKEKRYDK